MMKIDKNKKICAIILAATLTMSETACAKNEIKKETYTYSGYEITDNENGMKLNLTNKQIEEIENTKKEYINLSFGKNVLALEAKPIKQEIKRKKNSLRIIMGIFSLGIITSTIGSFSPIKLYKEKKKKETR